MASSGSPADRWPPVRIPYGRQSIDPGDVEAVAAVLAGPRITQGPEVEAFERDLADMVGARYAVAMSSGTSALHAAAAVAGLAAGSRAAVPALTFAASVNCLRFVGADPVLVDIDPATLNLDPSLVPPTVDALVAVHFAGLPVDLTALDRRPPVIIEDAAHALGASTPDGPVGNCAHSDLCCFSFHPVKAVTTGEGGAVTSNDRQLVELLRRWRNHGIAPRPGGAPWEYDVVGSSGNARLTDIQSALGRSQLRRLPSFIRRRNELADRYRRLLADLPIELPPAAPAGSLHAYHLFPIRVDARRDVYEGLRAGGIGVQVHYVPIHHHSSFRHLAGRSGPLTRTDEAYGRLLSLPLYPDLSEHDQDAVVASLRSILEA